MNPDRRAEEVVGQAGGVRRQLPDRHRRRRLGLHLAVFDAEEHLHLGEFGQVVGDRVGHQEVAFLEQQHDGGAGHRLALRVEPEDRVLLHRQSGGDVAHTVGLEVNDLAAPCDQGDGAGDVAGVDQSPHGDADALEAVARHADALGRGHGNRVGVGGEGGRGQRGHHGCTGEKPRRDG